MMTVATLDVIGQDNQKPDICALQRTLHYDVPVLRALLVRGDNPAQIDLYQQSHGINTFKIVGEAGYWQDTQALVGIHQPHAVIVCVADGAKEWLEVVQQFSKTHPDIRIALLANYPDEQIIRQAMRAGTTVFLSGSSHAIEIEGAIRSVLPGGMYFSPPACAAFLAGYGKYSGKKQAIPSDLTPRQLEVLRLIAESHTTKQIAHRLGLSTKTVETYRTQLMKRLGIHDVAGLVRHAIAAGLIFGEG